MEPSWHCLGPSWDFLGPLWAVLWPSWGRLGPSWGPSRASFGGLVAVLGLFWDDLDGLVALFGHLRAILSCPGPASGHLWPILEPCWCNSGGKLRSIWEIQETSPSNVPTRFQIQAESTDPMPTRMQKQVGSDHAPQDPKGLEVWGPVRKYLFGNTFSETLSQIHAFSHLGLCSMQAYQNKPRPVHVNAQVSH